MAEQETRAARRDWWVALGLFVSALSAAVSSFAGLHALALSTGWHPWAAPLFPLTVDCYALTAVRVWLARSTRSGRARRFARANAVGAILLSVLGNATWHLVAADLLRVGPVMSSWSVRYRPSSSGSLLTLPYCGLRTTRKASGTRPYSKPSRRYGRTYPGRTGPYRSPRGRGLSRRDQYRGQRST
jgi:hypothetical protein